MVSVWIPNQLSDQQIAFSQSVKRLIIKQWMVEMSSQLSNLITMLPKLGIHAPVPVGPIKTENIASMRTERRVD